MRGRITEILWDNCHDGENGQQIHAAADAIIAALPDMVAPLVWTITGYIRGSRPVYNSGVCTISTEYGFHLSHPGIFYAIKLPSLESAKAAANAYHRAAIMAAFGGDL